MRIIGVDETEVVLTSQDGLFLWIEKSNRGQSIGIWWDHGRLSDQDLMMGTSLCAEVGSVKVIGQSRLVNQIEKILIKTKKSVQIKAKQSVDGEVTVVYSPKTGRIRVPKTDTVRVLIVDDSAPVRTLLKKIFSSDSSIQVVDAVAGPLQAEPYILAGSVDVMTLDLHMDQMDGVTFLKSIMPRYPVPTVLVSALSMSEGTMVLDGLEAGAVDYVQKPSFDEVAEAAPLILEKVRAAARANIKKLAKPTIRKQAIKPAGVISTGRPILIGASTGGTEAIREVLTRLPSEIPPILIVQHIPAVFSKAFADRMNTLCEFSVKEAENGDELRPNRVLIAPGGKQMKLVRKDKETLMVEINDDPPVLRHKPSVDYMMNSATNILGKHCTAVILTGMGADGAAGMLALKNLGAHTIGQDAETSVVYGMPRAAFERGAVIEVRPLPEIADAIVKSLLKKAS